MKFRRSHLPVPTKNLIRDEVFGRDRVIFWLAKLPPLDIQAYYSRALFDGRLSGRGGLSAQTVLHHHRVLHEALKTPYDGN